MQSGHKHAALMAEYAKDAAETDKPWERWEIRIAGATHWQRMLACNPAWDIAFEYRRKPKLVEGWVNIYESGGTGGIHKTKELAACAGLAPLKTIFVREVPNE